MGKIRMGSRLLDISNSVIYLAVGFVMFTAYLIFPAPEIYTFLQKNPTLILLSISAFVALLSFRSQRHLTRSKNTIDFQNDFHSSDLLKRAAKIYRKKVSRMMTGDLVCLALTDAPKAQAFAVREILNTWERVAVAVRYDIYDEELLYKLYATFLIKSWTELSPYIKEKQKANPRVFVQLEWLALRWKIRRNSFVSKQEKIELKKDLKQIYKATD